PVTFPQRILLDQDLCDVLARYRTKKQIYVVTHFNHPKEITGEARAAIKALQETGVVVKNQTVFMRGINDTSEVLAELLRMITSLGIVQHYIFQCRPVKGVQSRFQVPIAQGSRIVQKALALQNGLGKSADYTMSHVTGKIRILGENQNGEMVFQYKQAKDPAKIGQIFTMKLRDDDTWLPDHIDI
ncbi:MAG: KamA family radical SAM protein, partial [Lachnospiraceae bacterium]|nr:KamA family radical SAM protein [Lachnospiraceae bacterium]